MMKATKTERLELYKDRNVQAILSWFLSGEEKEIEPVYDSSLGYHYPAVEAIIGDSSRAESFMGNLYEAGILERGLYDKVVYCPKCGSANVSVLYCCPHCKSFDIQRSCLIEHSKCGYMDVEENFKRGDHLVCPKCLEELKRPDVDYRRAGVWCTCNDCRKNFDIPVALHFCRSCHDRSSFESITIKNVYSYKLKDSVKEEAALGWVLIAPIRDFLMDEGFDVKSPAFLKGKSGANHLFDIVACKENPSKVIVFDLATFPEDAVSEQPVIALFAKIFDASPNNAYLIVIPKMSENGRKMAKSYNIHIIEASDPKEAIEALKKEIQKDMTS